MLFSAMKSFCSQQAYFRCDIFRIDYLFTMQRLMLSKFLKDFFPIIKTRILVSLEANSLTEGWYNFCCALPFIEQRKL